MLTKVVRDGGVCCHLGAAGATRRDPSAWGREQHPAPAPEKRESNQRGRTALRTQIYNFPFMSCSLLKAKSRLHRLHLMHANQGLASSPCLAFLSERGWRRGVSSCLSLFPILW